MFSLFSRAATAESRSDEPDAEDTLDAALAAVPAPTEPSGADLDTAPLEAAFEALLRGAYDEAVERAGPYAGPVMGLADGLRRRARADLDAAVGQTAAVIGQTIGTAELYRNANETTRHTESIAAAVEQLAATAASIADNCKAAAEDARQSVSAADKEGTLVTNMNETMDTVSVSVTEAMGRLDQLSESTARIGSVIEQIESIARQTNLLALNATIEAARAGEAGRGFAVVAGEVRALADKTSVATQDIRERVGELTAGAQAITGAMGTVETRVTEGNALMDKLGDGIVFLRDRAGETGSMIDGITETVSTQSAAAEDISQTIQTIAASVSANLEALDDLLAKVDAAQTSATDQLATLGEADIPGKAVVLAKTDHLLWVKRVASMLIGRETIDRSKLANFHGCRFGKWFEGNAGKLIANTKAYRSIDEPHRAVHACGVAAAEAYERGDMNGALEAFERMVDRSKVVIALLDELAASADA
jgi:methyl-accepting chemotaxis protein